MIITLKRNWLHPDGVFGNLGLDGLPFAVTVENDEYLIPPGLYKCKRTHYINGDYETFEIIVKGRTRILFHKGVIENHSLGCIITGEQFDIWKGKTAVFQSTKAFEELMQKASGLDEFYLKILERY